MSLLHQRPLRRCSPGLTPRTMRLFHLYAASSGPERMQLTLPGPHSKGGISTACCFFFSSRRTFLVQYVLMRLFPGCSPHFGIFAHTMRTNSRRGNLAAVSTAQCLSDLQYPRYPVPFCRGTARKSIAYANQPPFACLSLRFVAPPRTALRFQGHRLGTILSAQYTGRHRPEGKSQSRDRRKVG